MKKVLSKLHVDQLPWKQGEDFWEAPWDALPVPGSESKDRCEDKGKSRTAFEYNPICPSEAHFTGESREAWGNPSPFLTGLTAGKDRLLLGIISDLGD